MKPMKHLGLARLLLLAVLGCGSSGEPIDYLALPADEAARIFAEDECEQIFRCGLLDRQCDEDGSNCRFVYVPASEAFASQAECVAAVTQELRDLLQGCAIARLDSVESTDVNACLNSIERRCLTPEELATDDQDNPFVTTECLRAEPALERCDLCEEAPDDERCR